MRGLSEREHPWDEEDEQGWAALGALGDIMDSMIPGSANLIDLARAVKEGRYQGENLAGRAYNQLIWGGKGMVSGISEEDGEKVQKGLLKVIPGLSQFLGWPTGGIQQIAEAALGLREEEPKGVQLPSRGRRGRSSLRSTR